jgi:hypothetical protein
MHYKTPILEQNGCVVLRDYDGPGIPEQEYRNLQFIDWKSGGDTNFAPIASATGDMGCGGFWEHGKPDKDGIWNQNAQACPSLVRYVQNIGARFGRVRVIKLWPNTDREEAYRNLHLDDNNRLNPGGEGWVVRAWLELTHCPDSYMILREAKEDAGSERRIPTIRYRQMVIDTERLWHAVSHLGPEPRYALITSLESGPELERWIRSQLPVAAPAAESDWVGLQETCAALVFPQVPSPGPAGTGARHRVGARRPSGWTPRPRRPTRPWRGRADEGRDEGVIALAAQGRPGRASGRSSARVRGRRPAHCHDAGRCRA